MTKTRGPKLRGLAWGAILFGMLLGLYNTFRDERDVKEGLKKARLLIKEPVKVKPRTKSPMKPEMSLSSGNGYSEWCVL